MDATHVIGKLPLNHDKQIVHYITFNGEQIHAPKGTGALWVRKGAPLASYIVGGIEQAGLRGGALNVAGLVGLSQALTESIEARDLMGLEGARLRNKLEEGIVRECPGAVVFFKESERVPNITAIGFPGISNEALLFALSKKGVFANIGGGSFQQISLVLMGGGIPQELANTGVSFSLSKDTSEEDVDRAIEIIASSFKQLSKLSYSY